ncbi:MAG: hypothetical protein COW08_00295 [Ignavibacteriales bacterium CG12_big_fil_rev_8_21_14_0_65_30_8]|nr:MAG: hypothetical protein COW08_00295 [Ignavibacteriales bacterium CG12_big_fil_rev_8_21_14_0_65_30_8]
MIFLGEFFALLTAISWSGGSFSFAEAAQRVGSIQLNVNRVILASVFLSLTILVFNFDYSISGYQFKYLVVSGIIGIVIGDTFLFSAYKNIGARLSMLLMSTAPIISTILAFIFLNESIGLTAIVGIAITISGIILVVLNSDNSLNTKYKITKIGIILGLLGAAGQAIGLVFAKEAFNSGELNGFVATFVRVFASVLFILPVTIIFRKYKNPIKLYLNDPKAFLFTVVGTVFGPFLGITLSLLAIKYTKIGIASTIMATVPVIMLPMSKYLHKEKFTWKIIIGTFMAVGGVAIIFLR